MMDPSRVDVVLVRPARPANVAAACRAMKNMGLGRLRIVGPPPGLADPEVRSLAYGAWDLLDAARPAASLLEAVGDATLVAGTSGRSLPDAWTPRRLAREAEGRARGGRLSLVFGPERSGLTSAELEQAVQDLRAGLLEVGYLNPANPDDVLAELRRLLARAGPTSREVTLLRGLARQISWAGRKTRGRPGI